MSWVCRMDALKELCSWMVKAGLAGPAIGVGEPNGPPMPEVPATLRFSSKHAAWTAMKTVMDSEAVEIIAPYMRGSTYDEKVANAQSLTSGLEEAAWEILHSRNSEPGATLHVPQAGATPHVPVRLTSDHVAGAYWMAFLAKDWEAPGCVCPLVDVLKAELQQLVCATFRCLLNLSVL